MDIRKTAPEDLCRVLELYEQARSFMRANGNPTQWTKGYPDRETVLEDIRRGRSYVLMDGEQIACVFCFFIGEDPTYKVIEGAWLNDRPYGVVHRIASGGARKGACSFCLNWCLRQCGNLRVDTHKDNLPMQKAVLKNGFQYCGIIHIADGSPRLAYQRVSGEGRNAP